MYCTAFQRKVVTIFATFRSGEFVLASWKNVFWVNRVTEEWKAGGSGIRDGRKIDLDRLDQLVSNWDSDETRRLKIVDLDRLDQFLLNWDLDTRLGVWKIVFETGLVR